MQEVWPADYGGFQPLESLPFDMLDTALVLDDDPLIAELGMGSLLPAAPAAADTHTLPTSGGSSEQGSEGGGSGGQKKVSDAERLEKVRAKNRRSQARFRQRQKVRAGKLRRYLHSCHYPVGRSKHAAMASPLTHL